MFQKIYRNKFSLLTRVCQNIRVTFVRYSTVLERSIQKRLGKFLCQVLLKILSHRLSKSTKGEMLCTDFSNPESQWRVTACAKMCEDQTTRKTLACSRKATRAVEEKIIVHRLFSVLSSVRPQRWLLCFHSRWSSCGSAFRHHGGTGTLGNLVFSLLPTLRNERSLLLNDENCMHVHAYVTLECRSTCEFGSHPSPPPPPMNDVRFRDDKNIICNDP